MTAQTSACADGPSSAQGGTNPPDHVGRPRRLPVAPAGLILRPASAADAGAIAIIWSRGWRDGHEGHVSDELVAARTDESFRSRAAERVGDTVVASLDGVIAGFVMVVEDEVEQVYVAREHRGTGVAAALLTGAERMVAGKGHRRAWLAVAAGNTRARRFYERNGWIDEGPIRYPAATAGGPVWVVAHRYAKPAGD